MPRLSDDEINDICTEWENDRLASLTIRQVAASLRELVRLRAGLPKLKDGSAVVPGQTLYYRSGATVESVVVAAVDEYDVAFVGYNPSLFFSLFYATKEEAENATE